MMKNDERGKKCEINRSVKKHLKLLWDNAMYFKLSFLQKFIDQGAC